MREFVCPRHDYKIAQNITMSYSLRNGNRGRYGMSRSDAVSEPAFMKPRFFVSDSADDIMDTLREGWHLVVQCRSEAVLRNSYWYGEWIIFFLSPDEQRKAPLLRVRPKGVGEDMRLFKTVNGLFTFLVDQGVDAPWIPKNAGETRRQELGPRED